MEGRAWTLATLIIKFRGRPQAPSIDMVISTSPHMGQWMWEGRVG